MEKSLFCKDLGFDCNYEIRAKTDDEVLKLASVHARKAHGINRITPEIENKVRAAIREKK